MSPSLGVSYLVNKWYELDTRLLKKLLKKKLKLQILIPLSIPIDLSRINESRYLAWHISIYRVSGKHNSIFLFSADNDLACLGIRALGFQNIKKKKKTYFMAIIIDIESHTHTKSCCDL